MELRPLNKEQTVQVSDTTMVIRDLMLMTNKRLTH